MSQITSELAPTGVLRAAINMSNFLLVTGKTASGDPQGVAPDMAGEIARRLGVPVTYVKYERPSHLADAAGSNVWDIGLIGAEPQRAEKISFTPAYCEIEATYLVPPGSPIASIAEVDRPGVRITTRRGAAYCLWLERNIKQAKLLLSDTAEGPFDQFVAEKLEAYASLRPQLLTDVNKLPGLKNPAGQFHDRAAGDRHRQSECRGGGVPQRLCRRSEKVGTGGAPDREASRQRPIGGAVMTRWCA